MSSSSTVSELDMLKFYRTEVRFESELLAARLNALLSSQSFLVIAYAASMSASEGHWDAIFTVLLPPCLALLGLVLAMSARPGIHAAQAVIDNWSKKENQLHLRCPELAQYSRASTALERQEMSRRGNEGVLFAKRAPLVFVLAWCIFSILPFYLHFHSLRL
jgi:hypothetical protein